MKWFRSLSREFLSSVTVEFLVFPFSYQNEKIYCSIIIIVVVEEIDGSPAEKRWLLGMMWLIQGSLLEMKL